MSPANRIIINTMATYGQSVVAMILGLLSARWTLQALGHTDFGLFGVVGSIILLVSFLNGGLSVGVVRFFAYSIGEGKNKPPAQAHEELQKWFNTALSIHLILPILIVAAGWPLGEHAIRHWLDIPSERVDASIQVFRFALVAAFISIFSVPYTSMFHAQQRLVELAVIETIKTIAIFFLAFTLLRVESDRLVFYAFAMMLIVSAGQIAQILRATWLFPACRPQLRFLFLKKYVRKLFGFVGWKMIGMACVTIRQQGTPVFANLAYGPVVNAAFSIASRLSTQASTFSGALYKAFQPTLTSAEGSGDRKGMLAMAIQFCNFSTLLVALFAIPLILEMDALLVLWLVDPPLYTAEICRWLLAMLIIDKMTAGPMIGVNARGKIAIYEIVQGPLIVLSLPLMWLLFRIDQGPPAIGIALFTSAVANCVARIIFAKYLIDFPVTEWFRKSAIPLTTAMLVTAVLCYWAARPFELNLARILISGVVSAGALLLFAYFWILSANEKNYIIKIGSQIRKRILVH